MMIRAYKFRVKHWLLAVAVLLISEKAMASGVVRCINKTSKCVAKLEHGVSGQRVQILDETARPAGNGIIAKRRGKYILIKMLHYKKTIKKNYPVVLMSDTYCYKDHLKSSFSNSEPYSN